MKKVFSTDTNPPACRRVLWMLLFLFLLLLRLSLATDFCYPPPSPPPPPTPPSPPPLHIFCVLLSFPNLHLSSLFCAQRPLPRQTRGERTLAVPSLLKGSGCCCPRCRCRVLSTATGYCRSSRPFSRSSLSCFLFPVRGYSVSLVVAQGHLPPAFWVSLFVLLLLRLSHCSQLAASVWRCGRGR